MSPSLELIPPFPGDIKWNFGKFLIGRDGKIVKRFEPKTTPDSPEVTSAIEAALASNSALASSRLWTAGAKQGVDPAMSFWRTAVDWSRVARSFTQSVFYCSLRDETFNVRWVKTPWQAAHSRR